MTSSNIRGRYSVGRWFTSISSLQYQLQLHVMSLIKDHIQQVRLSQDYLASSAKGSCQGFVIFYLSVLRLVLLQKAIVSTVLFSGILFSGLSCKARKHSTHFLCPREVTQTSFSDITDHFNTWFLWKNGFGLLGLGNKFPHCPNMCFDQSHSKRFSPHFIIWNLLSPEKGLSFLILQIIAYCSSVRIINEFLLSLFIHCFGVEVK